MLPDNVLQELEQKISLSGEGKSLSAEQVVEQIKSSIDKSIFDDITPEDMAKLLKDLHYSRSETEEALREVYPELTEAQLSHILTEVYGEPIVKWTNLRKLGVVGGSGSAFDDVPKTEQEIKSITKLVVRSGNIIDQIKIVYGDHETQPHGGNGGGESIINLDSEDYLEEVSGYYGTWFGAQHILQLTFKTNKGKVFGPYGNMEFSTGVSKFSFKGNKGEGIVAFYGTTFTHTDGLKAVSSIGVAVAKREVV